jgi:hypothetical protein
MRLWLFLLFAVIFSGCVASPLMEPTPESKYPDLGLAPELSGDVWLNVNAPLRLVDLRGKVVLIDMWTFG